MATNAELDPVFRQAIRLLHSPNNDAAENIRKALDDLIKQRHGPSKMLVNTLSKKYLAEESLASGSGFAKKAQSKRRSSHKSSDSSSNNSNSSPAEVISTATVVTVASGVGPSPTSAVLTTSLSGQRQDLPLILAMPENASNTSGTESIADPALIIDNQHLEDLEDLVCVVCRRINTSAKNRLIECTKCNSLYHQECHVPQISDSELADDQESSWCCANCKAKVIKSTHAHLISSPAKSSHSSSSSSSSSSSNTRTHSSAKSNSSSSKKPTERTSSSSSHKSKSSSSSSTRHHHHHHKSHHHSSKEKHHERSSGSNGSNGNNSSSKSGITPNINIISADKRLQIMKKKAAKSHESKRKK